MMQTLSGSWKLATDPTNAGRAERWFEEIRPEAQEAPVPGVIQQVFPGYHGVAWYWHLFRFDAAPGAAAPGAAAPGERLLLRFGAVDYLADVWLNGRHAGTSEGGETPFEFDVTGLIGPGVDNLLAVRVLNPTNEPIDGYVLKETPHRNKVIPPRPGSSFNSGGIMYPVALRRVPAVYIADLFARGRLETGELAVTVGVRNTGAEASGSISLSLAAAAGGDVLRAYQRRVLFPPGDTEHEFVLPVGRPRLWEPDDPFLYRVSAEAAAGGAGAHRLDVRAGFRDLRIIDGYFHLNGRRIFLKSTHTGNHMPIGQQAPVMADLVRRDLLYAKASGFNCVRFIAGVAYPEQLDFCDEIGLMVWESSFAGWCLADSPFMAERYDRNTSGMVRRDRNHPCVAIWELLNETNDGPVFRHAAGFLPALRALDRSRLVLLSSGRWDGDWTIGSASNPGSDAWEPVWGVEGPGAPLPAVVDAMHNLGYVEGAGDAHYYPRAPQSKAANDKIRSFGRGSKPVLLSEYGMGSLFDVIREARHFEQAGARTDLEDAAALRLQSDLLTADWHRLGFDATEGAAYAFPEDLLRESQRLHARQRTLGFDLVRANPQLCGYNLTGMLDHGMTGEGVWTFWREWKPATFDAVADGWAPLRWCLFVDPMHGYAGRAITVEAVLATEDVLAPGEYPARFRIMGPHGVAWEKRTVVTVPDPSPLAIPVLRETVTLEGPAGQYLFAAVLERGGAAAGGRLAFHLSDPAALPALDGDALLWGIDRGVEERLAQRGLRCRPLAPGAEGRLVLIGKPAGPDQDHAAWAGLGQRLAQGATLLFLSAEPFRGSQAAMEWLLRQLLRQLPVSGKGRCYAFNDWLYHKECVAKRHPVFAGLQAPGIMDWDYYGPVIPRDIFEGMDTPDETIAAAFATGYHTSPTGYVCGILIAAYRAAAGRLILSTPYVLENLGTHPAADRVLINLVQYAQQGVGAM